MMKKIVKAMGIVLVSLSLFGSFSAYASSWRLAWMDFGPAGLTTCHYQRTVGSRVETKTINFWGWSCPKWI